MEERPWMNATLPVTSRVTLLLAAMTLQEKVAQLGYGYSLPCDPNSVHQFPHGMGGCQVGDAATGVTQISMLRQALSNLTRLGIPPSV